ncbi:vesicle transport protein [Dissophora ornata]|nr:vesicle transport protein [Dissophora ornata]
MATSSPSALEVNLRRLMAKCDAKVRSSDKILQGSDRTKYALNIKVMNEMLTDLEEELTRNGKVDTAALKEYAGKIDSLASVIEGQTLAAPINKSLVQARMVAPVPQTTGRMADVFGTAPRRTPQTDSDPKRELFQARDHADRPGKGAEYPSLTKADDLSGLRERRSGRDESNNRPSGLRTADSGVVATDQRQVEAALQNDRAQREEMEAGLSLLMQQLRHNAMSIQQTLVDEQKSGLLDDADQALDNNISRLGKERTRLELYSKQSRKTKWMIWGVVLGVSLVFVIMFFVIRIF